VDRRADDFWRGSLAPFKRPLLGLSWSKFPPAARLHDLNAALKDFPGTILSLVWDEQRAELEGSRHIIDAGRHLQSMPALIDLIGRLDCVVAPDGLVMHIAGAMGVPGVVLLTPDKPWYWHEQQGRSYWYPSLSVLTRRWQEPMTDFQPRIAAAIDAIVGTRGD
jgi:ADP-heptose:LPS heptosyltransferase